MIITWYGHSCFRIQSGNLTIAIDPFSKEIGLTAPRFRADIVLVTHNHYDHSNIDALQDRKFVITGPGEYEIGGVMVKGVETFHDAVSGQERGLNTIYRLELEDIKVAHMGDFGEQSLPERAIDTIGDADILMIPVGGVYTIDGKKAAGIVRDLQPPIVIPMHYKLPGLKLKLDGLDKFLDELEEQNIEKKDKLSIKKKDLKESAGTKICILSSPGN